MEITWLLVDSNGNPLTGGAANTSLRLRRAADGYLLDWSDLTFKAGGGSAPTAVLEEISAADFPGVYRKVVDVSAWEDGWYQVLARYAAAPPQNGDGEFYLQAGEVAEEYLSGAVAGNLDASVSSVLAALAALENISVADILEADLGDEAALGDRTLGDLIRKLAWFVMNRLVIVNASGDYTLYKTDGVTPAATGRITDNGVQTERRKPEF